MGVQKWYLLALNIKEPKLHRHPLKRPLCKQPSNILKILLKINKGVELLNIARIFNHIIYTFSHLHIHIFTNPYSPKFSILTNVSIGTCIRDDSTLLCHCADSCVKDKDKGHILTQDLKIIDNNKLRKLSTGGTKYRKRMSIKLKETMSDLVLP